MAVFRIERTRDYTVMSNHHLRNANLSLKAKGLLSMMLSLPEDWNYTTRGLAKICKEGVDAIGAALRELEGAGYIVRHQRRDKSGRITDTEYVIYEQPQPDMSQPDTASPDTENPDMVKPDTEKPAELNIEKSNTEKSITYGSSTDSIPFRETAAERPPERKGRDAMSVTEIENYRELILENIEYDCLKQRYPLYLDDLRLCWRVKVEPSMISSWILPQKEKLNSLLLIWIGAMWTKISLNGVLQLRKIQPQKNRQSKIATRRKWRLKASPMRSASILALRPEKTASAILQAGVRARN
ncbi:DUF6017 domain-containing protein [Gemmiger formicilis]